MSDVLLTKTQRTAAKRLMPRAGPSSSQAKPLTNAETGTVPFAGIVLTKMGLSPLPGFEKAVHPVADHPSPTWPDVATTLIPEKIVVRRPSRARRIIGTQGLVADSGLHVAGGGARGAGLGAEHGRSHGDVGDDGDRRRTRAPSRTMRSTSSLPHPNSSRSKRSRISPTGSRIRWMRLPRRRYWRWTRTLTRRRWHSTSIGDLQAAPAAMDATPLGQDGMPEERHHGRGARLWERLFGPRHVGKGAGSQEGGWQRGERKMRRSTR